MNHRSPSGTLFSIPTKHIVLERAEFSFTRDAAIERKCTLENGEIGRPGCGSSGLGGTFEYALRESVAQRE